MCHVPDQRTWTPTKVIWCPGLVDGVLSGVHVDRRSLDGQGRPDHENETRPESLKGMTDRSGGCVKLLSRK